MSTDQHVSTDQTVSTDQNVWIDQHCHLPDDLDDAALVVEEARAADVVALVDVGCDVAGSLAAIERAGRFDMVSATAGVHPHEARHGIDGLAELLVRPEVVAVGECGLDHHYDHSPHEDQRRVFAEQIRLAHEHDLPLVIHTREAWDETFEILDAEGMPRRTVFHCFTGGAREAELSLERGGVLSFSGIVTFPSAKDLHEAAVLCPIERLMVETDSPYLAPVPRRGKKNQPAWVVHVGERIAELKDLPIETVARRTTATAREFFGLTDHAG